MQLGPIAEWGLNMNKKIGGVFPIAGFTSKVPKIHRSQIKTPLIIGHGSDDEVIDISSSEISISKRAFQRLLIFPSLSKTKNPWSRFSKS